MFCLQSYQGLTFQHRINTQLIYWFTLAQVVAQRISKPQRISVKVYVKREELYYILSNSKQNITPLSLLVGTAVVDLTWQVISLFYLTTWKFIYIIIQSGWSLAWIFMKERVRKITFSNWGTLCVDWIPLSKRPTSIDSKLFRLVL